MEAMVKKSVDRQLTQQRVVLMRTAL